jgi:hypothetical protein
MHMIYRFARASEAVQLLQHHYRAVVGVAPRFHLICHLVTKVTHCTISSITPLPVTNIEVRVLILYVM